MSSPRVVFLRELQPGDVVLMPFDWGSSVYLIISIEPLRRTGQVHLRYLSHGTPPSPEEAWLEETVSVEPAGSDFCRRGHLLRGGEEVPAPSPRRRGRGAAPSDSDLRRGR